MLNIPANNPELKSWVTVIENSDFPIQNLQISNLLGSIMANEANISSFPHQISLNNYKKGVYLVYFQQNNTYYSKKIIIK